jgi:hypothetical protein
MDHLWLQMLSQQLSAFSVQPYPFFSVLGCHQCLIVFLGIWTFISIFHDSLLCFHSTIFNVKTFCRLSRVVSLECRWFGSSSSWNLKTKVLPFSLSLMILKFCVLLYYFERYFQFLVGIRVIHQSPFLNLNFKFLFIFFLRV